MRRIQVCWLTAVDVSRSVLIYRDYDVIGEPSPDAGMEPPSDAQSPEQESDGIDETEALPLPDDSDGTEPAPPDPMTAGDPMIAGDPATAGGDTVTEIAPPAEGDPVADAVAPQATANSGSYLWGGSSFLVHFCRDAVDSSRLRALL